MIGKKLPGTICRFGGYYNVHIFCMYTLIRQNKSNKISSDTSSQRIKFLLFRSTVGFQKNSSNQKTR